ncbi:MAG: T9SS type A sorting domain-containing protein, partial [Ignavibacteria bacterium]
VKIISLLNIQDETTFEKVFAFSSLDLAQNDSVKIENLGSDNFKLISYGTTKNYDIELNYGSQTEQGRFMNVNIPLPSNSSHTFIPNWNNVTTSQLVILQDIGNNGTIDDTIRVINIITNTEQGSLILPDNYSLYQNYPNPFNPSTVIKYDIKNSGLVSLKVYNVLGSEVASLVNEVKQAGRYEVEFNGLNLNSGIYYYRLQAGEYTETKKMLLLK